MRRFSYLSSTCLILLAIVGLSGCGLLHSSDVQAAATTPPTPTINAGASIPQIGITAPGATTLTPTPTCTPDASAAAIQYTAETVIDVAAHTVSGTLYTTYQNQTGVALPAIVFNIVAAHKPGQFSLTALSAGANSDSYTLDEGRLTVMLRAPLLPDCTAQIGIGFTLAVPPIASGVAGKNGYFGYSARQLNLGDWLPAVVPYIGGEWVVPRYWPNIGETTTTDAASYRVALTVRGANPDKLIVAAPGTMTHTDATTWHFALDHARNFALSLSEAFQHASLTTPGGLPIELYTFARPIPPQTPGAAPIKAPDSAAYVLTTARDALTRYESLFGPCIYRRLVIVQGDFPDGMEFSGIVFVGGAWFAGYENQPAAWLTLITAHELAHQWWYGRVGNDQSQHPFLDESLATYSELLYLETAYPTLVSWWWNFRIKLYQPEGSVDASVYDFTAQRPYINAVYLRGVLMLNEVRTVIGEPAFIAWLHAYAAAQTDRIATVSAFWGALSAADYARTAAIRARYLHDPDPLRLDVSPTPPH